MGAAFEGKNSKDTASTMATTTMSKEEWEETYLKLVLLYVDRVGFVQSFLVPSFPSTKDLPSLCGVLSYTCGVIGVIFMYFLSQWRTIVTSKEGATIGPNTFNQFFELFVGYFIMLTPIGLIIAAAGWYCDIGSPGRIGALMAMAQKKPPYRDHSKPYGFTWYKDMIKVSVYSGFVSAWAIGASNTGDPFSGMQIGLLLLVLSEPLQSINEKYWKSTAIGDAEVCITAGMQSQCMFAEGGGNSIAVNVKAVAQLQWRCSKLKEQVKKAVKSNKNYKFKIFDVSTGHHTMITPAKMEKLNEDQESVAKLVMQELFKQRGEFMDSMA